MKAYIYLLAAIVLISFVNAGVYNRVAFDNMSNTLIANNWTNGGIGWLGSCNGPFNNMSWDNNSKYYSGTTANAGAYKYFTPKIAITDNFCVESYISDCESNMGFGMVTDLNCTGTYYNAIGYDTSDSCASARIQYRESTGAAETSDSFLNTYNDSIVKFCYNVTEGKFWVYSNNTIIGNYTKNLSTSGQFDNGFGMMYIGAYGAPGRINSFDWINISYNTTTPAAPVTSLFVACGNLSNTTTINVSIFDEDYLTPLKVDTSFVITTTAENYTFYNNNSAGFKICINPNTTTTYIDAYAEYEHVTGYNERYYLINATVNATTQYVTLYNFNTTSTTSTLNGNVVYDSSYADYPDVVSKLLRYYPTTNEWKQVQVDKSDQFGKIYFYIHERDTLYQMVFQYYSTTIYTTDQLKFSCTSGVCDVTIPVPSISTLTQTKRPGFNIQFNNATKVVTVYWSDSTGLTHDVWVEITKELPSGKSVIANLTGTSSSGSLSYNLSSQEGTILVRAYSAASPWTVDSIKWISIPAKRLFEIVSQSTNSGNGFMETGFWSFGIVATSIFAAAITPMATLIGLSLGLAITSILGGFNFLTIAFFVGLCIAMAFMMVKLRK